MLIHVMSFKALMCFFFRGLTEKCPICQKDFQKDLIEQHADMCAISTEKNSEPESR